MPGKRVHFNSSIAYEPPSTPSPQFSPPSTPSPQLSTPPLTYSSLPSSDGPITPPSGYSSFQSYGPFTTPWKYYGLPQPLPSIHPVLLELFYDVSMHPSTIPFFANNPRLLSESATGPPLPYMSIIHPLLPWAIKVTSKPGTAVSIADLLEAIYRTLRIQVTHAEYNAIPTNGRRDSVAAAFSERCKRLLSHGKDYYEKEKSKGLKRVDFLLGSTTLVGLSSTIHGSHVWELNLNGLRSDDPNHEFRAQKQDQEDVGRRSLSTLRDGSSTLSPTSPYLPFVAPPRNQGGLPKKTADSPAHHGPLPTTMLLPPSGSSARERIGHARLVEKPKVLDVLKCPPPDTLQRSHPTSLQSTHSTLGKARSLEHETDDGEQRSFEGNASDEKKQLLKDEADHDEGQSLDDDGDREGNLLEGEAGEAAFVVCWPQGQSTPSSKTARSPDDFPCFNSSWDGGCMLSVYDSNLADSWIDGNFDHQFLTLLRDKGIGGPIASMLSFELPVLAIFGAMSMQLIQMANELAELSAFPVIVRPLEEDPSPYFRNHGDGSSASKPYSPPVESGSQSQGANNDPGGSKRNLGKQRQEDTGSNDEGDDPPDPPPPLQEPDPKWKIIHRADITLTVLINNEDKGHSLRVITKAESYPVPNSKDKSENNGNEMVASEPSIEGHVQLETRSSESIQVDVAAGSVGFLANEPDYLGTEYLVSLGYDKPPAKFKIESTSQVSKSVTGSIGLAGGKPTARLDLSANKLTGTMTGLTDDEVAKPWIVSPQHGTENWESEESCYRSLTTNIYRSPTCLKYFTASDIIAKYGIAVEVAEPISNETQPVSFIYRHQIHCWVAVESRARVRGLIVLTAHYVPDICTMKSLRILSRPSLNITCKDMNKDGGKSAGAVQEGSSGLIAGGTSHSNADSEDRFIFSTATMPEPEAGAGTRSFFGKLLSREPRNIPVQGRKGKGQVEPVPMLRLVGRGWNRKDMGWDHREQRWYHPVWPKLNGALSPDESKAKWKLDWEQEGGFVATEIPNTQEPVAGPSNTNMKTDRSY